MRRRSVDVRGRVEAVEGGVGGDIERVEQAEGEGVERPCPGGRGAEAEVVKDAAHRRRLLYDGYEAHRALAAGTHEHVEGEGPA